MDKYASVIYITYDGVMEPLGNSQVLAYLKHLSNKGMEFHLVSFEKKYLLRDKTLRENLQKELEGYNIKWYGMVYHKRFRILATAIDILTGIVKTFIIALKVKPSIIHARSYVAAFMAWVVCTLTRSKFVFDMRGFWPDERVDAGLLNRNSLLYRLIKGLERMFIRSADRIVVLTHKAKSEMTKGSVNPEKISVIPCCADTNLFRFDKESREEIRKEYNITNRFVLVHTGSLIGWYMLREMLDYFKAVKERDDKALLMLLSDDLDKGNVLKAACELGITRNDIIIAKAKFNQVYRYLSSADMGLFFIKPTFSKRASCPVKFAEYMSCGLPVVCNRNIGDLDDIIEENKVGLLVDDFNKSSYTDSYGKLKELLNDKELKTRCRVVARTLFDVDKGAESYLKMYRTSR